MAAVVVAAPEERVPLGGYTALVRERCDAALAKLAEGPWLAFVRGKAAAAVMELFLKVRRDWTRREWTLESCVGVALR